MGRKADTAVSLGLRTNANTVSCCPAERLRFVLFDTSYLDILNTEQRCAVEHGIGTDKAPPLLVIAGAGSGKTNTLAHRVAHLVVNGCDPPSILLLTFSRRAAAEMATGWNICSAEFWAQAQAKHRH